MLKRTATRFFYLLSFLTAVMLIINNVLPVPAELPEPSSSFAARESCVVGSEAARVHDNGYENAWIQFVNNDNTVQVKTIDTNLTLAFKVAPNDVACFHENWIAPVTIESCFKIFSSRCNFNLPHIVYVRSQNVKIISWKY